MSQLDLYVNSIMSDRMHEAEHARQVAAARRRPRPSRRQRPRLRLRHA